MSEIGLLMLMLPFIGLFVWLWLTDGLKVACLLFLACGFLVGWMLIGAALFKGDLPQ